MARYPTIKSIAETNAYAVATHVPAAGAVSYPTFVDLVQDNAPFDIKRRMEREFQGSPIKLGDEWYEYSTPGNIAYGFYGSAAGYDPVVIHAGAGAAQLKDAYLDHDGPPGALEFGFDTPDDYYAIEFGIQLYAEYYLPDGQLTQAEFVFALNNYDHRSALAVSAPPTNYKPINQRYPDDYFINK